MKALVIGSGGREHAIAWKLSQSPQVKALYTAPGSDAMAVLGTRVPIAVDDAAGLAEYALKQGIDLTVVGPEAALAAGVVDAFKKRGLRIFGPDKYAAQLEASKTFAKEIMKKRGIPTAEGKAFTDFKAAVSYVDKLSIPLIVVKSDGLCAGKGVVVASDKTEAKSALKLFMVDKIHGKAGEQVLIEDGLVGEEASLIAISDGTRALELASSQDHKRLNDGDEGPNTGGMGAYSPAPVVTDEIMRFARERIFQPVIDEFKERGHPYVGFLYAGIMVVEGRVWVLEFNVRLGDPETQAILPRLESDLFDVLYKASGPEGLKSVQLKWKRQDCVCVVIAAEGYPAQPKSGEEIQGLPLPGESSDDAFVFHAGTEKKGNRYVTRGGRVLGVTALGSGITDARKKVYEQVSRITFKGMHYRKDIAHRALERVL